MTTRHLAPILPGVDLSLVALVLERLEDEVRHCGAAYGVVIDRAGQIVAVDGPIEREDLAVLALKLVPVFLVSRSLAKTFREWPVATVEDSGPTHLITQPLGAEWLLAMAFGAGKLHAPPVQLAQRWIERLGPLTPRCARGRGRRRGKAVIARDSIDLIFKDE